MTMYRNSNCELKSHNNWRWFFSNCNLITIDDEQRLIITNWIWLEGKRLGISNKSAKIASDVQEWHNNYLRWTCLRKLRELIFFDMKNAWNFSVFDQNRLISVTKLIHLCSINALKKSVCREISNKLISSLR